MLSKLFLVLLLSCLLLPGCIASQSGQLIKETSAQIRPSWTYAPPKANETYHFVVGVKSAADSLEDGMNAAIKDASGRIAGFLKSQVATEFQEKTTSVEQILKQQLSSKSQAIVTNIKLEDQYYEKLVRLDQNYRVERYDVYVLVSYSVADAKKELLRQAEEEANTFRRAKECYLSGIVEEQSKQIIKARQSYIKTATILKDVHELITLDNGEGVRDSEQLKDLNAEALIRTAKMLKRVRTEYQVLGNDGSGRVFTGRLTTDLSDKGIEICDNGYSAIIQGMIEVKKGGYVMDNVVRYATGTLELRSTEGELMGAATLNVKGFGSSESSAEKNAMNEAAKVAAERISKLISSKIE